MPFRIESSLEELSVNRHSMCTDSNTEKEQSESATPMKVPATREKEIESEIPKEMLNTTPIEEENQTSVSTLLTPELLSMPKEFTWDCLPEEVEKYILNMTSCSSNSSSEPEVNILKDLISTNLFDDLKLNDDSDSDNDSVNCIMEKYTTLPKALSPITTSPKKSTSNSTTTSAKMEPPSSSTSSSDKIETPSTSEITKNIHTQTMEPYPGLPLTDAWRRRLDTKKREYSQWHTPVALSYTRERDNNRYATTDAPLRMPTHRRNEGRSYYNEARHPYYSQNERQWKY